jgi:hypothetical protein
MKAVFAAQSPAEAHLVAGVLEEAGIRCVVEGEMLFGVRADIGLTPASLPRVCVMDGDAARAFEVIAPHVRRIEQAAREEDEDAAPRPPLGWGAARIVGLWLLVLAAVAPFGAPALRLAVPMVGVAIWVHLLRHFDRPA